MVRTGLIALTLLGSIGLAQAQPVSTLPGGASALQETHQDWLVACAQGDAPSHSCVFSQSQTNQDGQRVLSIELTPDEGGRTAHGTLILPFGLFLNAGVGLQIDDGATGEAIRFTTCLSIGCVVPVTFGAAAMPFLRAGQKLNIHTKAGDGDQALIFPISLAGFAGAVDRTVQLLPAN